MWNKIKKFGYLTSAKYVFLGTILAVLIFQFATISITNSKFDFNSLIEGKTIILIISSIVGVFISGLIQISMSNGDKNGRQGEHKLWEALKKKNKSSILIRFSFAFAFGGLVGLLTKKALDTNIDNDFFQALFSNENIIDYFGIVLAASVFGIFITLGTIKRLKEIYED